MRPALDSPETSPKPGLITSAVSVAWVFVPCILQSLVTMSNVQCNGRVNYPEKSIILILSRSCNVLKSAVEA